MVRSFDACEADFFGDMAGDSHGLWEVFEFVRLHYSSLSEHQVFERGRDYITRWIDAGWIRISDAPLHSSSVTSLFHLSEFLQRHGLAATRYMDDSPSIDPTEEALRVFHANI